MVDIGELIQIREEFTQELRSNSKLLKKKLIRGKEIDGEYSRFLEQKYGGKYVEKENEIYYENSNLIEEIMFSLGFIMEHDFKGERYRKCP